MEGITKRLRAWLDKHPEGQLKQLYAAFEADGIRPLNKALARLERRGELNLPDPTYRYTKRLDSRKETKQQEFWYVLRSLGQVRRLVDIEELLITAEVSEDYGMKYIRFLERQGYVKRRKTGLAVLKKALDRENAPVWNCR